MVIPKPVTFSCRLNELQAQELPVWMTAPLSLWDYCVLYHTTQCLLRSLPISVMESGSVRVECFFFHWCLWRALSDCQVCGLYGVVLCEYWLLWLCVGMESVSEALQLTNCHGRKKWKQANQLRAGWAKNAVIFSPDKLKSHKIGTPYSTWK